MYPAIRLVTSPVTSTARWLALDVDAEARVATRLAETR
jgi:hypothetical protein